MSLVIAISCHASHFGVDAARLNIRKFRFDDDADSGLSPVGA
jgi:hypothetical protein